jgi:hypothetical protein
LALTNGEEREKITAALDDIREEMNKPLPQAKQVAEDARAAADLLQAWLKHHGRTRLDAGAMRRTLGVLKDEQAATDWDSGAQRYRAMTALHRTLGNVEPRPDDRKFDDVLHEMARRLQFPPGYDSPREAPPR